MQKFRSKKIIFLIFLIIFNQNSFAMLNSRSDYEIELKENTKENFKENIDNLQIYPANINYFLEWLKKSPKETSEKNSFNAITIYANDQQKRNSSKNNSGKFLIFFEHFACKEITNKLYKKILLLLGNKIQELILHNFDSKKIDLKKLEKSTIKKFKLDQWQNIASLKLEYLPETLEILIINGMYTKEDKQEIFTDKNLKQLPQNLKELDVADVFVSGECFDNLPKSIEKIRLGRDTTVENLIKLNKYKNLNSLCLKRTRINWSWLKPEIFQNLLVLCTNDQFADNDIKNLPKNLQELDLTQCQDESFGQDIIKITGKNFKDFPKTLKTLKLISLKAIEKKYLESEWPKNLSKVYIEDCEEETLCNAKHKEKIKILLINGVAVLDNNSHKYSTDKHELEIIEREEIDNLIFNGDN